MSRIALLLALLVFSLPSSPMGVPAPVLAVQQAPSAFRGIVDLPGVHLWYSDSGGSGIPVILLHANTGTADSWENNTQAFVDAGYRVIAFDRRGWGRSTADPTTGAQPGTVAEDLQALVDELGLDRFHLVGVAGGGFVAYDYALWHPERLRSLVVAASGGGISEDSYADAGLVRVQLPGFADWPFVFREVSLGYQATNPQGLARWMEIYESSQRGPSQPLRSEITLDKLETIQVPTLLLPGDNDLGPAPYVMRMQAQHLPEAQLIVIPEAGHSVNWEQPETFDRSVLDFIALR